MKNFIIVYIIFAFACCIAVANTPIPDQIVGGDLTVYAGANFREGPKEINLRKGTYHFGESESEWTVAIIPYQDGFIVQTSSFFYSANDGLFLRVYSTARKSRDENGLFLVPKPYSAKGFFVGRFIEKKGNSKMIGILLDGNSEYSGKNLPPEVGFYYKTLEDEFGEHYRLSCTVLDDEFLIKKSAVELSFMRNEIYAYYGIKFKSPLLKNHFEKQKWYYPWKNDVTDYISELEWANIRLIQKHEKLRQARLGV